MDGSRIQPFVWRLMFIFLIYVPGSTLNTIKDTSMPTKSLSLTAPSDITIPPTVQSPLLQGNNINDRTFQKTPPSDAQTTTSLIRDSFVSSTTTTTTSTLLGKSTRTNVSSAEWIAPNFRQHSLNPLLTVNTTRAVIVANELAPLDDTTTTTTMKEVTKATLWNAEVINEEAAEIGNSVYSALSSSHIDGYGSNIELSSNNNNYSNNTTATTTNNNSSNINNNSSDVKEKDQINDDSSNRGASSSSNNRNQQQKSKNLQQRVHEFKYLAVDLPTSKQYVRQVQQELSTISTATATATTTETTPIRRTGVRGATLENNDLLDGAAAATVVAKNVRKSEVDEEDEKEYELPTKEKLKMPNPELTTATTTTTTTTIALVARAMTNATTDAVTILYETTALPLATSTPAATPTSAAPIEMTTATSSSTTTTTTTAKPKLPLAVDGYQTITSQAGTHAYLPCNVKQLVKKPISWLRVRDGHILTVDQTTFIADQRFQSIYTVNPERWSLQIKYVQTKDAGTYECQVSTEPKTSAIVTLQIVEPKTELIGESTRHVKAGSQVKLRCIISQALEPPLFINWFYNQKQIYLHNRRGWRTEIERIELPPEIPTTTTTTSTTTTTPATTTTSATTSATKAATTTRAMPMTKTMGNVGGAAATSTSIPAVLSHTSMSMSAGEKHQHHETATLTAALRAVGFPVITAAVTSTMTTTAAAAAADVKQITTASLIIPSVEKQDSGNYTCSPSNSAPITVVLHVLNGEYSASAITSGISSNFILIGQQRSANQQKQHSCWNNTPTILALLWIIRFLHSMKFGRDTTTAAARAIEEDSSSKSRSGSSSSNMNDTGNNNKGYKCASSQVLVTTTGTATATATAAIKPKSTIKLIATTIPWVLAEEKT